ncbi:MAG: hypothetical protein FWC79_08485 [Oscillospiraceae bacterium]|nr:hypothetical protein [Oscillospiraceae bacterium]
MRMRDRKGYLQEIAILKKEAGKRVLDIEECLNNHNLLRKEFKIAIEDSSKKIFSLSDFTEVLAEEKEKLQIDLIDYTHEMDPTNYVKTKLIIAENVEMLTELGLEDLNERKIYSFVIELQKEFLAAFEKDVKRAKTKKEIVDIIYRFRFYKRLPVKKEVFPRSVKVIREEFDAVEKELITKACKSKVLIILSSSIAINFDLFSNLTGSRIIKLEDVVIEFKKKIERPLGSEVKTEKTLLRMYEDTTLESTREYDTFIDDIEVKYNRKIEVFL